VSGRALLLSLAALGLGCRQDMHDQPKLKPYAESGFFADQRGSRQLLPGTVARGQLREDRVLFTGLVEGKPAAELPFPLTQDVLERGQQRYLIYCAPCHGQVGRGDGIVVRRGYRKPTTFHDARLRGEPVGYYFDVMTRGFGAMPDYAAQVPVRDRWAIAAYVKTLQLSQYADAKQLGLEIPRAAASPGARR
jgi:mono/diheme cytochrome c family protein